MLLGWKWSQYQVEADLTGSRPSHWSLYQDEADSSATPNDLLGLMNNPAIGLGLQNQGSNNAQNIIHVLSVGKSLSQLLEICDLDQGGISV
jgi:hypothetical protein